MSRPTPLNRLARRAMLGALAVALLVGCGKSKAPGAARGKAPLGTGASATVRGGKPTEAEATAYAQKVVDAIMSGGPTFGLLDMQRMVEVATEDLSVSARERDGIRRGAAAQFNGPANFLVQFRDQMGEGGDFRVLRIHEVDGQRRVLFRMVMAEGGVNYSDFVLEKNGGNVTATDIYVFMSGEFLTDTLEQLMETMLAQRGGVFGGGDEQMLAKVQDMQAFAVAAKTGRNAEALRLYRGLPREFQDQKAMMILRLQAASEDDAEYTATLERYRELFPNDPAIELVSIDYYILREDFDSALAAVEATTTAVGGDPFLDSVRAGILAELGKHDEAGKLADEAIAELPDIEDVHWAAIQTSITSERFEKTLQLMQQLDRDFEMEWSDLRDIPEYEAFVASPQFAEWETYLRSR